MFDVIVIPTIRRYNNFKLTELSLLFIHCGLINQLESISFVGYELIN